MRDTKAIVDVGNGRIALGTVEGVLRRGADGRWIRRVRSPADIIQPQELARCRVVADDSPEYWDLLSEAMRAFSRRGHA